MYGALIIIIHTLLTRDMYVIFLPLRIFEAPYEEVVPSFITACASRVGTASGTQSLN